jgi:hypothetical protein
MYSQTIINEQHILAALRQLPFQQWQEVLKFIAFLKYQTHSSAERTGLPTLTAHELLHSELVGLWADRADIEDHLGYARQLRQQAEHRHLSEGDE